MKAPAAWTWNGTMSTFFEAVQVRDKLKQFGDLLNQLSNKYIQVRPTT